MTLPSRARGIPGGSEARYRCRDVQAVPFGAHEELVRAGPGRAPVLLPAHVLDLARRCDRFRTLAEHARDRCRELALGSGEVPAVTRELEALVTQGVLVSVDYLLDRCAEARAAEPAAPAIGTLGLVARGRPEGLAQAILSHADGLRACGRRADVLVVDDGRDATAVAATRAALAPLAARPEIRLRRVGRDERRRFAAALAAATGVAEDLAAFGLLGLDGPGTPVGAARNAVLLCTTGEVVLSVDDDLRWHGGQVPGAQRGPRLDGSVAPWQWWCFEDRQAALRALEPGSPDALAPHEALLGRSPSACLAGHASADLDLDGASARLIALLEAGQGRVVLTLGSLVGDPGWTDPVPLDLAGPSRQRLLADAETYRRACAGRGLIRGVTRPTIGDRIACSTLAMGMDGRALLPPFLPVGGGAGVAFGVAVRLCVPGACTGCVPATLRHAPVEPSSAAPEDAWRTAGALPLGGLLVDALATLADSVVGVDAAARMRSLGGRLGDLGGLATDELAAHLATARRARAAARIAALESALGSAGGVPESWAENVRRHVATLGEALAREDADVPDELRPGRSPEEARAVVRGLLGRYGALLRAWPDLVEAARALRARGLAPGERAG